MLPMVVTHLITYVSKLGKTQCTVNSAVKVFKIFDVMIVEPSITTTKRMLTFATVIRL
jgi:hypothetical protein